MGKNPAGFAAVVSRRLFFGVFGLDVAASEAASAAPSEAQRASRSAFVSVRACLENVSLAREISRATSSVVGGGGSARVADGGSTAVAGAADTGAFASALPPLAAKKSVILRRAGRSSRASVPARSCRFEEGVIATAPVDAVPTSAVLLDSERRAESESASFGFASATPASSRARASRARRASAFLASSSANARSAKYTCSGGNWFVSSRCTARFTLRFASEASFSRAGIVRAVFRSSAFNRSTLHRTNRPRSQVSPLPGDRSCNGAMRVIARGFTITALTARSTSPETPTGSHGGSAGNASTDPLETPRGFRDISISTPCAVPPAGGTSHAGHCAIPS